MKANNGVRPRQHYFALVWVWVAVVATTLLYLLFVNLESWRPHSIWWMVTTAIIAAGCLFASWLLVRCIVRGKQRVWAIAMFMLTIAPLVWFTSVTWATLDTGPTGLKFNLPFRTLGIWAGSWFELEARLRYPRITDGKHVQLFDDGQTPDVQQLVSKMDLHIESMAKILEQPIALTKTRWVRGSISGLRGRSLGAWAICDRNPGSDLHDLDRHEVAHSVITMMCPIDQGMPMLLAEGWAESNSTDRGDSILALYRRHRDGEAPTLVEITNCAYASSNGNAYSVGAPLAWYLLEAFGGDKFHELYGGVKRDHFEADVLRILGVTWQQVDQDFWKWLVRQAEIEIEKLNARGESQSAVSFDRPQDQARWDLIVSEIKEKEKRGFPERLAVNFSRENFDCHVVIEPNGLWCESKDPAQYFEWLTAERCDYVMQVSDGIFDFVPRGGYSKNHFTAERNLWRHWLLERWSLKDLLQLDFEEPQLKKNSDQHRIHSITEGATISAPWTINYSTLVADAEAPKARGVIKVDPQHAFDVISLRKDFNEGKSYETSYEYGDMGGHRIVKRRLSNDESKKQTVQTIAEMSSHEIDVTKQAVEAAVSKARTNWRSALVSPKTLAFAWPLMALMMFGIDWRRRRKMRETH